MRFIFWLSLPFFFAAFPVAAAHAQEGSHYSGKKISLDVQKANIHNVLRILAEISGCNIVTSSDVAGDVTMKVTDVPWDQVLALVLRTNGLYQVREGSVIMVVPVEKVPQLFLN